MAVARCRSAWASRADLHAREPFIHVSQDVAQIEALVEGDLVVARPPRVELASHGPSQLDEPPLHVHVDVLELLAEGKAAALQLALHGFEPGFDLSQLAGLDEPGALEGAGPRSEERRVGKACGSRWCA